MKHKETSTQTIQAFKEVYFKDNTAGYRFKGLRLATHE
jgi:hypothetical protein